VGAVAAAVVVVATVLGAKPLPGIGLLIIRIPLLVIGQLWSSWLVCKRNWPTSLTDWPHSSAMRAKRRQVHDDRIWANCQLKALIEIVARSAAGPALLGVCCQHSFPGKSQVVKSARSFASWPSVVPTKKPLRSAPPLGAAGHGPTAGDAVRPLPQDHPQIDRRTSKNS